MAAAYGLTPDPWQRWVINGWTARRNGMLAASRCGLAVPRQNGKNAILEAVELFKIVVLGRRVLHTAHEVKTARKAFLRLCSFFENRRKFPELADLVLSIRRTNGQEAIFLVNGGSVEFIARSKGSGRGFTVDDLVCDEAQELSDDALAALYPTISAAPSGDPQLILTGTPPAPKMDGEVFTRFRKAGAKGEDGRLCWDEWSVPLGSDVNDLSLASGVNPALGIRLSWDVVRDERAAMDDETFGRERLGMWDDDDALGRVVSSADWLATFDAGSKITGSLSFGLDVSPMSSWAAIGVVGKRADGVLHLEITSNESVVDHRPGVDWVVPRMKDLASRHRVRVFIARGSAAESLVPDLEAAGVTVEVVTAGDVAAACGQLKNLGDQRGFRHLGQPSLTGAVQGAALIDVGDGAFKLGRRKSTVDITPAYAIVLALHGANHAVDYDVLDSIY